MTKDLDKVNNKPSKVKEEVADYPIRKRDDEGMIEYREPAVVDYPFFNFRYAYVEVTSHGGKTCVKARETRLENGKLISEECEGSLDHNAAHRMMIDAHNQFINQMTALMKPFFAFSPFRLNRRSGE